MAIALCDAAVDGVWLSGLLAQLLVTPVHPLAVDVPVLEELRRDDVPPGAAISGMRTLTVLSSWIR